MDRSARLPKIRLIYRDFPRSARGCRAFLYARATTVLERESHVRRGDDGRSSSSKSTGRTARHVGRRPRLNRTRISATGNNRAPLYALAGLGFYALRRGCSVASAAISARCAPSRTTRGFPRPRTIPVLLDRSSPRVPSRGPGGTRDFKINLKPRAVNTRDLRINTAGFDPSTPANKREC